MDSLKFMVTWSLFLACCILVVNIRPSLAMPIEGDQNSDKFEGIYDLLTQRIQNLSQGNDESIRRTHIPMALSENSMFEDTNNSNATTIPSRNSHFSRLNQQSEKNTPVVPMATGYAGNILQTLAAGKFPEEKQTFQSRNQPGAIQQLLWQQSTRNQPVWQHNSGNSAIIKLSTTKSMAGNRFLGSLSTTFRNQTAGATQSLRYQMTGNSPIMNNSTVGSHFNGNDSVTNSSTGNYQSQSSQYKMAGKEPVWKQSAGDQTVTGSSLSNAAGENLFQGNLSKNNSQLSWYQVAQNQPLWKQNAGNQFAAKYLRTNPLPSIPFPSAPGIYPSAAAQSSWYQMARNQFIAKQDVGNQMMANLSLGNLTAGNRFVSNRLYTKPFSGDQPVKTPQFLRYQMAGNYPLWKQNAGNQVVANSSIGISTARDRFQGSILATKTMAGTVPLTKAVTGKQMAGNLPAKNSQVATLMTMNPKVQISPVVQKWPVTTNLQTGGLQVRGSLASARRASPLILPSPSKAGLTYNRGQSSIYKQPSSYDSKGAIYAPSSVNFGQPPKLKNTAENVKKSNIFSPFVNRPWFQYYPPMGNRPTFQPRYTGYPDFFFQHGRRDYQTTSPHQRLQEHHSKVGNVRDKLPTKKKFKHHEASKKSSKKSTTNSLTKFNTIQIKLPDKLSTSNSATLSQSASLDDDTVTEELASASGSGFEFPNDLTDADGFEEPEDFSVSGSGNDDGYLNPGLIGGTSDIAFMLADAKNRPPAFPAPGLPMNLTRQQAIDIYKSAMYFAGLMGADSIDGYSEESGDIGNDADDDNDDDDKSDHSFPDEDDNDVTITDSDIKEALDASSGELDASGQQRADVDSSGSQPETTGSDNSTSKDEGGVTQKQPSESQAKVNSSSLEESTNRTEGNQSQDGKSEAPQESAASLQTPPPVVSDTNQLSNDKQSVSEADDDDDTPPPDETLTKAAQANYAADQQAEKAMYFMSHTRQSGAYSSSSKRAIICRGTTQKISCPPDKRLRILNADYGDTGDAGCLKESNPEPSGPCRTPGAFEIVRRECDGYEDCALPASNEVFGDACPDANKYLDVNYDCVNNAVAPAPAAYSPASYPAPPPYVNPLPPPVSYAPAPYQVPPPASYGGLPDLLPPSPYVAPNPCNPCNTCAQCALPACSPCGSTCQILTCGPQIPAKLQPLWQQFNERTADMSRMEMAALIISPLPKLAPTKAPESSGAAEGSESGEPTLDEDALYEENKKSKIQRIKPQKTSKKTSLTAAKKKADKNSDNEQGFLRNTDSVTSSGDASSGGSST